MAHHSIEDPDTGGEFTVKVYSSEKRATEDSGWEHSGIVLKPINPAFEPIELSVEDDGDVRVVADFVTVVPDSVPDPS